MKRQLIVNADDFARSEEVNRGIIAAHLQGIVTTTTVMINLVGAREAMREASSLAPELGIGLHLNLTLGAPCSPLPNHSGLTDSRGQFWPVKHWHNLPNDAPIEHIETEWRAQIELFQSTGQRIDHLDSHHHIAAIREDIWHLYLNLAGELNCGVRPPYPDDVDQGKLRELFPMAMLEHARDSALPALKESSRPHPMNFLASFFDEQAHLKHLHNLLHNLPVGTSELMCHPGYSSATLEATSSYARQRQDELEALIHPQTRQLIEDLEIALVTYLQVWPNS